MAHSSAMAFGSVDLDSDTEANLAKLLLAIVEKPIATSQLPPTVKTIENMFKQHYHTAPYPTEISYFPPDFILQFNDKASYDTILSYQAMTDDRYTFSLTPWREDSGCHTQIWKTPVTIDIRGIPPHLQHIRSICSLLNTYCDVGDYEFDKITGVCTVEGKAESVNSIPTTGTLLYLDRSYCNTIVHTFPVTIQASLLTTPGMRSEVWKKIKDPEENMDPDDVRNFYRATFEAEMEDERQRNNPPTFYGYATSDDSSDDDDPNAAYYYPDSDWEPIDW